VRFLYLRARSRSPRISSLYFKRLEIAASKWGAYGCCSIYWGTCRSTSSWENLYCWV